MSTHKFPFRWRLSDGYPAPGIDYHGSTVFGTFICGGGSTMGYKLAGYHHLGGVEINPKVASVYRANHAPELLFVEDLRKFNDRTDLPDELYALDLLDGSPPCTTFSMAGDREDAWGVEKSFSEGGMKQRLDDLVFVYCETIAKLRPKVCLLENVAGLLRGNAKSYAKRICERLNEAGYRVQVFLLSAANMGVPQLRQRSFFVGLRNDLAAGLPPLELHFDEPPIPFGEFRDRTDTTRNLSDLMYGLWLARKPSDNEIGDILRRQGGGEQVLYLCDPKRRARCSDADNCRPIRSLRRAAQDERQRAASLLVVSARLSGGRCDDARLRHGDVRPASHGRPNLASDLVAVAFASSLIGR